MYRLALLALILTAHGAFAISPATSQPQKPTSSQTKKTNVYSAEDRRLFIRSCTNATPALHDFCVCVITEFQATMTFQEFSAMNDLTDEQLRRHQPYVKAILKCVKKPV